MNLEARISELARDAMQPLLAAAVDDLEARLTARLEELVRPPAEAPSLLGPEDVAAYLGVTPRTVRRLVADRGFPAPFRITPGTARWRREDVDAWLERRREP